MNNIERFIGKMPNDIDGVLITSRENRYYFTGFSSSAGVLIITRDKSFFIIDFRYYEKAKKEVASCEVLLLENFVSQVKDIFKDYNVKTVGVEALNITLNEFEDLKSKFYEQKFEKSNDINVIINKMRQVKLPFEIDLIKQAQSITDSAFEHILNFIKAGLTEKQIAAEIECFMRKLGADGVAFDTISVSGKNSSLPHGVPTYKQLQAGDFLTMDFGARVGGYCSDMTRTVCIGQPNELQRHVYDTVLKAQQIAFNNITEGAKCKNVDKAARDYINSQGYEGCFGHGLGHSVGLEIHESPSFNKIDETILEKNMVLTVEPGIYLENNFGVRIEDMVIVAQNGYLNLTKSIKDLISL